MRDTPEDIEARFLRQLMGLTAEQRLAMTCRMFAAAKALVCATTSDKGAKSPGETRALLFLRLYGQDFSETERAKILAHLGKT